MKTIALEKADQLANLLRDERAALGDFLIALADFDRDRLWESLGYNCLFNFLHRHLGLSKGAACYRNAAAELLQRVPQVIEPLRDGRLCMTVIIEAAHVLTPDNAGNVLPRFYGLSKREAKLVAASLSPSPKVPQRDTFTLMETGHTVSAARLTATAESAPFSALKSSSPGELSVPKRVIAFEDSAEPVSGKEIRMHITVSVEFYKKLERAKAALSQKHPNASAEEILNEGLDLVLKARDKRKGITEKPRKAKSSQDPHHIAASVKAEVWKRDGGRCQWALESGGVCGTDRKIQYDHIVPPKLGGDSSVSNVRCLCHAHNQLWARQTYGEAWMSQFTNTFP